MKCAWIMAAVLVLPTAARADNALPPGTILPVSLDKGLNAGKVHAGMEIRAKVMQDIPGTPVRRGAEVIGHIVKANPPGKGKASLELTFDAVKMHRQRIPLKANLRALASFLEVEEAEDPEDMSSRGLNEESWTTQQIGGDQVYRGGGPVTEGKISVGTPTPYGVLVVPRAQPDLPCCGAIGASSRPQAFWLFSANACGVYGYSRLRIAHAGRTTPAGTVVLIANRGKLVLYSGSGMLLRVLGM